MAKEDKRREVGRGVRPQRNEKGGAGNGRMAEYSSRTRAPSVAATESRRSRFRNQKPGIALIQNYLDSVRLGMRGAFAAASRGYAVRETALHIYLERASASDSEAIISRRVDISRFISATVDAPFFEIDEILLFFAHSRCGIRVACEFIDSLLELNPMV